MRIAGDEAGLMLSDPCVQIISVPDIETVIGTAKHIGPKAHDGPSIRVFAFAQPLLRMSREGKWARAHGAYLFNIRSS